MADECVGLHEKILVAECGVGAAFPPAHRCIMSHIPSPTSHTHPHSSKQIKRCDKCHISLQRRWYFQYLLRGFHKNQTWAGRGRAKSVSPGARLALFLSSCPG